MLIVVADAYDGVLDLSARRDRFTCEDFSFEITPGRTSGKVILLPEQRTLFVSNAPPHYVLVRVIDSGGTPIGTMGVDATGLVTWITPDLS